MNDAFSLIAVLAMKQKGQILTDFESCYTYRLIRLYFIFTLEAFL